MKITNKLGLPSPFVEAVSRDYQYKDKQYSVTALLKGVREAILQRRHNDEIEQDCSEMAWAIFGTAVHSILENAQEMADELKETKLITELPNGYKLSGVFDLYKESTATVIDYKTATVWKVIYNDWEDYRKQLLIYCWQLRQIGFEANSGEIVAFLKDHSKSKAKYDSSYPQQPIYIKHFDFTENDFKEIEAFIIEACENLTDDELPICTPVERWHKDDTYAVKKEGRKTAIKVCNSSEEAYAYIADNNLDSKHYVEERLGADTKCEEYCSSCEYCSYWRQSHDSE